jgi:FkbM family methyltransferase
MNCHTEEQPPATVTACRQVDDLIIDVGAHQGLDSEFYLRKGFRVVAIEANPRHVSTLRTRLASYIQSRRLVVLDVGVFAEDGTCDFYRNLDNDEWSSFDPVLGTRDGTAYDVIKVRTVRFDHVLREFGVPHYLKIDIEGAERHVFDALLRNQATPKFISAEAGSLDYLAYMRVLGYGAFQLLDQTANWRIKLPNPPREGTYVDWQFGALMSGPFGAELPGVWQPFARVAFEFLSFCAHRSPQCTTWYDFHGARPDVARGLLVNASSASATAVPAAPSTAPARTPTVLSPEDQVATIIATLERMKRSGVRSIVIAGSGSVARSATAVAQAMDIAVLAMDDAAPGAWGHEYRGVRILPPNHAVITQPNAYLIGSFGSIEPIRRRLAALPEIQHRRPPVFELGA